MKDKEENDSEEFSISNFLKKLMDTAQKNVNKKKQGNRYDEEIKLFASYLFIMGGRMIYEFLHANLPDSMPSVSTIEKVIATASSPVEEGFFRFEELARYLDSRGLPHKVFVSEDGTRIISKFQYDPKSNQIVGPVLPVCEEKGIPLRHAYPATSAALIARHFVHGIPASTAYVIMAQPLRLGSAAFCLAIFGTDNSFTNETALKRWKFIRQELKKVNIDVVGFASDGDPKLLRAMHKHTFPEECIRPEEWKDWYLCDEAVEEAVFQDWIHKVNKFKTRLLKPSIILPIGDYIASSTHLRVLVDTISKSEHGLTNYDFEKKDKMNFDASVKMSSKRVVDCLEKHVHGSYGTIVYLNMMRHCISAFSDENMTNLERIYSLWYVLFLLRIWRKWLLKSKNYNLENNFVTSNLYLCMEINAHAFIKLMRSMRDSDLHELFIPSLFSSQACEKKFGILRSMTSTFSTVINFSTLECLHRIKRADLQEEITCKLKDKYVFPRDRRKTLMGELDASKRASSPLPLDIFIYEAVMSAKRDAHETACKLGMIVDTPFEAPDLSCVGFSYELDEVDDLSAPVVDNYAPELTDDDVPLDILCMFPDVSVSDSVDFSSNTHGVESLPSDSLFVMIKSSQGNQSLIRKSTLCWLLTSQGLKVSSDRMQRVRTQVLNTVTSYGKRCPSGVSFERKKDIAMGDWCIFRRGRRHYVAHVLAFSYLTGKPSERSYSLPSAPVKAPSKKQRGLGCLCQWFDRKEGGKLSRLTFDHEYVDIESYVASIPVPVCNESGVFLDPETDAKFCTL